VGDSVEVLVPLVAWAAKSYLPAAAFWRLVALRSSTEVSNCCEYPNTAAASRSFSCELSAVTSLDARVLSTIMPRKAVSEVISEKADRTSGF
jgi:hypothetical protein